ncbi:Monooxygenase CTB7 [Paramyrothecium foliicola]|nr:Monooxygenase CTB7 [Paramyrothecium foliicola]
MSTQRVLIVGGGIAGPVLAYWLGKNGFQVVVVERSRHQTQSGQVVDLEGPSQEIMSRMGLLQEIRASATQEKGIRFVNEANRTVGTFPAGQSAGASKEIEIMRPILGELIAKATTALDNVEILFGYTVSGIQKTDTRVRVTLTDTTAHEDRTEEYDVVVACDGLRSKTRALIFPEVQTSLKSLEVFVAFFDVPAEPQDYEYSRLCNMPGRKTALIKPLNRDTSSVYLGVAKFDQELHEAREARDVERQKNVVAERFRSCGWETDRLVRGMMETNNFYFEELSQVKAERWSDGRCVLLGDTAWCPSPLTGQGTNAAILGAYVLAHSMTRNKHDMATAFAEYEENMRPYVDKIQPIPFDGQLPKIINPDTSWGIWVQRTVIWLVSFLQLYRFFPDTKVDFENLPDLR